MRAAWLRRIPLILALVVITACASNDDRDTSTPDEPSAASGTAVEDDSSSTTTTTTTKPVETSTTTEPADTDPTAVLEASAQRSLDTALGTADGGIAVLWRREGDTLRLAAGQADANGTTMDPGRALRVGSITKPFVATMVMQLRDEGVVDLDAPLASYLPDQAPDATVTVRELLAHRSGVPSYTDQRAYLEDAFDAPDRAFAPGEVLGYVADIDRATNGVFAYSNTNYILLGLLIESIDGVPLSDALQRRIAAPLGLEQTRLATAEDPTPEGLVGGWSVSAPLEGDPAVEYTAMASSAWAAGSLVSSVDDLAAFLDGLFGGDLVSEDSLAQMTDLGDGFYGLGLLRASLDGVTPAFGHNGLIPGFSSTMALEPESGDVVIVLTNNDALNADVVAAQLLS